MKKLIFYYVGCFVCVSVEYDIIDLVGVNNVEIVNIGEDRFWIFEVENVGVKLVLVLVMLNGNILYINYGVFMVDVKG